MDKGLVNVCYFIVDFESKFCDVFIFIQIIETYSTVTDLAKFLG